MKITNYTSSYITNTKFNESEKKDLSVEIKHSNEYESESDKRMKLLDKKYSEIHKENILYANPEEHIYNKYRSQYSKEFRHDLSSEEREASLRSEINMLRNGKVGFYSMRDDSLFRNSDPIDGRVENYKEKAFQREQVNRQIKNLFIQKNVDIPDDENLTFSVDPNNFQVTVKGSKNIQLLEQIEKVLNDKNNGEELFSHIFQSSDFESEQMKPEAIRKYGLISTLRSGTGYNLHDLERKDGKFLTPDGQDVFELYLNRMRQNPYERNYVSLAASVYGSRYHKLAENGFDAMSDLILSINYSNNKLQDIGQKENYSDLYWLADLEKSVEVENKKSK
ncbi:DUF4885 family protein [Bacillus cereus]